MYVYGLLLLWGFRFRRSNNGKTMCPREGGDTRLGIPQDESPQPLVNRRLPVGRHRNRRGQGVHDARSGGRGRSGARRGVDHAGEGEGRGRWERGRGGKEGGGEGRTRRDT